VKERKDVAQLKERVIHARIPASLENEIKRLASGLRIPVSNLVRNILQDTLAVAEGARANVGHAVDELRSSLSRLEQRIEPPPRPTCETEVEYRSDPVFGWQELLLNQDVRCTRCDRALERGERAYYGMTGQPNDRIFICPGCAPRPGGK
jgi:hypothetical protein